MSYRVTNSMMQSLLLNDMHTNLNKLLDVQQQLSSQRKYQSASDNPNAVTKGMGLDTMLTEGGQYIKNLQDAISWLKFTDSALGDINDIFQRMRELAIYAGNGALESVDLDAIGQELKELKKELMSYANSTIAGEYLFAGLKTGTSPFVLGANGEVSYVGNSYSVQWEFSRNEVGKVSLSGNELFPKDEVTNSLKGIEVPLDFEWTGRNEILEFKVGWQTVKVRIPERWTDEIANGIDDGTDYNRYRDPGEELDGYTLQEIADLINNSTEMGDVSKLLKATVVTDTARNVQYLQIQSHTGETVRLTSWPETDPVDVAQGVQGAAYGDVGRTADCNGKVSIRFEDGFVFDVDVEAGDTLQDIATKLGDLPEGRAWAAYKSDGTNDWLDLVARNPGQYFYIEATGGAAQLFSPQMVSAESDKRNGQQTLQSNAFDDFTSHADGTISLVRGNDKYEVTVPAGSDLADVATAIGAQLPADITATVDPATGKLVFSSTNPNDVFTVTATGGLTPIYSNGASTKSSGTADVNGNYKLTTTPIQEGVTLAGDGTMYVEHGGVKYPVTLADNSLASLKTGLETFFAAQGITGTVEIVQTADDDGNAVEYLSVKSDAQITLSGYGSCATLIGSDTMGSEDIYTNTDHTHIGFAEMMGMETSIRSTEVPVGSDLGNTDVTQGGTPLHIKIVSGTHSGEIYIEDDADLTLEELAKRINGVCGSWLQAVVETDTPDGTNPLLDPLNNSGDNAEGATQRLVLRTIDGEPFAIYDGAGKTTAAGTYAQNLGISTALMGQSTNANGYTVDYPEAAAGSFFDENMPAMLEVTVGDRVFQVKVCRNNCYDAEKVAAAIVRQVNEQHGGTLLAWDTNDLPNTSDLGTFALYAVTGEPLRVVDKGYGDPRFTEYTGGVAMQLGIAAGITSSANMKYDDTFGGGTIRISTPGHEVDVPVLATDNLHDIANRIRDYAGDWLDVSFSNDLIDGNGNVKLALAAKDGSAVSTFDLTGTVATDIGIDTGLVGLDTVDLSTFPTLDNDNGILTITVNGATHTMDLFDDTATPPKQIVNSVEDLADMINTRFQGQDVRAEVITVNGEKKLAIWSPKGYTVEIAGNGGGAGNSPDIFGFTEGQASSVHGGSGQYNQVVTARTGNNQKETDFFGVLDNLINCVEGGHVDGISDTMLEQLDTWMSTLLKCRAQVGALTNRYTTTESRLTSNNTGYEDLKTKTVGIDLAETITQYEMASSIYEASLAAIARIMQPSLLDFLR